MHILYWAIRVLLLINSTLLILEVYLLEKEKIKTSRLRQVILDLNSELAQYASKDTVVYPKPPKVL